MDGSIPDYNCDQCWEALAEVRTNGGGYGHNGQVLPPEGWLNIDDELLRMYTNNYITQGFPPPPEDPEDAGVGFALDMDMEMNMELELG